MRFTIFGGCGFIGSALCEHLRRQQHEVIIPARDASDIIGHHLGHVIYAIGVTADFRSRPFDTIEAHVCLLNRLLRTTKFESWLYLSSTRVYSDIIEAAAHEDIVLSVRPNADGIYNLSKLTGEAICLTQSSPSIRIARLSNVYGPNQSRDCFLGSLIDDIANKRDLIIREAPESDKDYISLDDVCFLLENIALHGQHRIYNVASGEPLSHAELAQALSTVTSRSVDFTPNAPRRVFPRIDIARVAKEFRFHPHRLLNDLGNLLSLHDTLKCEEKN